MAKLEVVGSHRILLVNMFPARFASTHTNLQTKQRASPPIMANDLRKALEDRFESSVMNQEGVMDECGERFLSISHPSLKSRRAGLDICKTFSISADDLFFKWEAFSYSASTKDRVISSLTLEGVKDLRKRLVQDKSRDILSPPVSTRKVKTLPRSTIKNAGSSKGFSSPLATPRRAPTFETPTPTTTYRPKTQYVPPQNLATYDCRPHSFLVDCSSHQNR